MAAFDAERAWLRLKAEIVSKGSHGKRDLLTRIAEIEVECAIEDDRHDPGAPVRRLADVRPGSPELGDRRAASGGGSALPVRPING